MISLTFISVSLLIWNLVPDFCSFGSKFLFSSFPVHISEKPVSPFLWPLILLCFPFLSVFNPMYPVDEISLALPRQWRYQPEVVKLSRDLTHILRTNCPIGIARRGTYLLVHQQLQNLRCCLRRNLEEHLAPHCLQTGNALCPPGN